jgi:hypothetical protein|tara:strand:+ start:149 stop:715 length:567 start_codon:yes stop_codon:yes gene_type:complete
MESKKGFKRVIISQREILGMDFPFKASKCDFDKISGFIMNTYINFNFLPENNYSDIPLESQQDIKWVQEYIKDKLAQAQVGQYRRALPRPLNQLAQVNGFLESSYKRNHINHRDFEHSPGMTSVTVIKGTGQIVFDASEYLRPEDYRVYDLKPGRIFAFNSDIDYFTTKHTDRNCLRQLLIHNYEWEY